MFKVDGTLDRGIVELVNKRDAEPTFSRIRWLLFCVTRVFHASK